MKNDTISRVLTAIPALELEYRHLCFSQGDGIGFEPSMLMLENENRSLIDELAGFAVQQTLPQYHQVAYQYTPSEGFYPLAPGVGLAVLAAYTLAALLLANRLLRTRDA